MSTIDTNIGSIYEFGSSTQEIDLEISATKSRFYTIINNLNQQKIKESVEYVRIETEIREGLFCTLTTLGNILKTI